MTNRVAVVTGGSGAIGSAVCGRLSRQGWTVLAADNRAPGIPTVAEDFVQADITTDEGVAAIFDAAGALGELHALVNAHGLILETPVDKFQPERFLRVLEVNLVGAARMSDAAIPRIVDGGAIVHLSSASAAMGRTAAVTAYVCSKGAIESLTRMQAVSLGPRGIRVNAVAPGYVSHAMQGEGVAMRERQGGNETVKGATPMGRLISPEEVAEVVAFLCSNGASGVSGVVLPVDGGLLAY